MPRYAVARPKKQAAFCDDFEEFPDLTPGVNADVVRDWLARGFIDARAAAVLSEQLKEQVCLQGYLDDIRPVSGASVVAPWADGVPCCDPANRDCAFFQQPGWNALWTFFTRLAEVHSLACSKTATGLRKFVNVNAPHFSPSCTVLGMACQTASPIVVTALLELRADPDACSHFYKISDMRETLENVSPLHIATNRDCPQIVTRLLAGGANPIAMVRDMDSTTTPLHWAAALSSTGTIDAFIESGQPINTAEVYFDGELKCDILLPPILSAIAYNNVTNVMHLIKHGASLGEIFPNYSKNPAHSWMKLDLVGLCAHVDACDTLALLVDGGFLPADGLHGTTPPIVVAACADHPRSIYALVRRGANLAAKVPGVHNVQNLPRTIDALEKAALLGNVRALVALVTCRAPLTDDILDVAAMNEHEECTRFLVACGCSVDSSVYYHAKHGVTKPTQFLVSCCDLSREQMLDVIKALVGGLQSWSENHDSQKQTRDLGKLLKLEKAKADKACRALQESRDFHVGILVRLQDTLEEVEVNKKQIDALRDSSKKVKKEARGQERVIEKLKSQLEVDVARVRVTLQAQEQTYRQQNLALEIENKELRLQLSRIETQPAMLAELKKGIDAVDAENKALRVQIAEIEAKPSILQEVVAENTELRAQIAAAEASTPTDKQECAICFGELGKESQFGILPCMHVFCVSCLDGMSMAPHMLKFEAHCPYNCELPQVGTMRRWARVYF